MRPLRSAWQVLAGALWAAAAGLAAAAPHDPRVATTVEPVPARVTLSRGADASGLPLNTFAGYRVSLSNLNPQTLNRVFFEAQAGNVGSNETLVIDSVPGADCSGLGTPRIACSLAPLSAGGSTVFVVVVRAPKTGQRIDLAWRSGGDEGKGGGKGCCTLAGSASTVLVDPTSDTSFLTQMTSFIKPEGGTFFTGNQAVPTPNDGWTTLVKVPPFTAPGPIVGKIVESSRPDSCAPYALAGGCFQSELTLPGLFSQLQIAIRWDKSLFNLGALPPSQVKLFYRGSNPQIAYPIQVGMCRLDFLTYGSAPSPGRPCMLLLPRRLTASDTADPALVDDLEFQVVAVDNGVYEN